MENTKLTRMSKTGVQKVLESPAFWVGVIAALGQIAVAIIGRL
jgi:hypothetical protein